MRSLKTTALLFLLATLPTASGCLPTTSEAAFVSDRQEVRCEGNYPFCQGRSADCVIDEEKFMRGTFPSSRRFLVETPDGDWAIRVSFFLTEQLSPGTDTEVSWFEPGCSQQYRFQLAENLVSANLFEEAGRDRVFEVEQAVVESGDHLVEFVSDSTAAYVLKVDLIPRKP